MPLASARRSDGDDGDDDKNDDEAERWDWARTEERGRRREDDDDVHDDDLRGGRLFGRAREPTDDLNDLDEKERGESKGRTALKPCFSNAMLNASSPLFRPPPSSLVGFGLPSSPPSARRKRSSTASSALPSAAVALKGSSLCRARKACDTRPYLPPPKRREEEGRHDALEGEDCRDRRAEREEESERRGKEDDEKEREGELDEGSEPMRLEGGKISEGRE